ncbi:MAG: phosphatidate cytidylyltransferase [Chloroflexi bacterium]|nr:phosphatidate cytidylyltransferase [Chloroflexota bacterium]
MHRANSGLPSTHIRARHIICDTGYATPVREGGVRNGQLKRGVGIKDTSDFVPGHGGFLDRIDAVLFTTPLVYYGVISVGQ